MSNVSLPHCTVCCPSQWLRGNSNAAGFSVVDGPACQTPIISADEVAAARAVHQEEPHVVVDAMELTKALSYVDISHLVGGSALPGVMSHRSSRLRHRHSESQLLSSLLTSQVALLPDTAFFVSIAAKAQLVARSRGVPVTFFFCTANDGSHEQPVRPLLLADAVAAITAENDDCTPLMRSALLPPGDESSHHAAHMYRVAGEAKGGMAARVLASLPFLLPWLRPLKALGGIGLKQLPLRLTVLGRVGKSRDLVVSVLSGRLTPGVTLISSSDPMRSMRYVKRVRTLGTWPFATEGETISSAFPGRVVIIEACPPDGWAASSILRSPARGDIFCQVSRELAAKVRCAQMAKPPTINSPNDDDVDKEVKYEDGPAGPGTPHLSQVRLSEHLLVLDCTDIPRPAMKELVRFQRKACVHGFGGISPGCISFSRHRGRVFGFFFPESTAAVTLLLTRIMGPGMDPSSAAAEASGFVELPAVHDVLRYSEADVAALGPGGGPEAGPHSPVVLLSTTITAQPRGYSKDGLSPRTISGKRCHAVRVIARWSRGEFLTEHVASLTWAAFNPRFAKLGLPATTAASMHRLVLDTCNAAQLLEAAVTTGALPPLLWCFGFSDALGRAAGDPMPPSMRPTPSGSEVDIRTGRGYNSSGGDRKAIEANRRYHKAKAVDPFLAAQEKTDVAPEQLFRRTVQYAAASELLMHVSPLSPLWTHNNTTHKDGMSARLLLLAALEKLAASDAFRTVSCFSKTQAARFGAQTEFLDGLLDKWTSITSGRCWGDTDAELGHDFVRPPFGAARKKMVRQRACVNVSRLPIPQNSVAALQYRRVHQLLASWASITGVMAAVWRDYASSWQQCKGPSWTWPKETATHLLLLSGFLDDPCFAPLFPDAVPLSRFHQLVPPCIALKLGRWPQVHGVAQDRSSHWKRGAADVFGGEKRVADLFHPFAVCQEPYAVAPRYVAGLGMLYFLKRLWTAPGAPSAAGNDENSAAKTNHFSRLPMIVVCEVFRFLVPIDE